MPIAREHRVILETPIGDLRVCGDASGVTRVLFDDRSDASPGDAPLMLRDCVRQLREYFFGERRQFDSMTLAFRSTDFQRSVWDAVCEVGFGEITSYQEIAKAVGKPLAVRAVGTAVGRNNLPIIVPCHRIVSKSGELPGNYGGNPWRKEWLLRHEGVMRG